MTRIGFATPPSPSATMLATASVVSVTSFTFSQRPSTIHIKKPPKKNDMPRTWDVPDQELEDLVLFLRSLNGEDVDKAVLPAGE